jgi:hypothetical protein
LKKFEIKKGDVVLLDVLSWEPYPTTQLSNNRYGKLWFKPSSGEITSDILQHSITEREYIALTQKFKDGEIPCKVKGANYASWSDKGEGKSGMIISVEYQPSLNHEDRTLLDIKDDVFAVGENGVLVGKKEYLTRVAQGCAWCTQRPRLIDADDLYWIPGATPEAYLCKGCSEEQEIMEAAGLPPKTESTYPEYLKPGYNDYGSDDLLG